MLPLFYFQSLILLNWSQNSDFQHSWCPQGRKMVLWCVWRWGWLGVTPPIIAGTVLLIKKTTPKFREQGEILLCFKSVMRWPWRSRVSLHPSVNSSHPQVFTSLCALLIPTRTTRELQQYGIKGIKRVRKSRTHRIFVLKECGTQCFVVTRWGSNGLHDLGGLLQLHLEILFKIIFKVFFVWPHFPAIIN